MYQRMNSRPSNHDTDEMKSYKEGVLVRAFLAYLAGTGDFSDWDSQRDNFASSLVSPPLFVRFRDLFIVFRELIQSTCGTR